MLNAQSLRNRAFLAKIGRAMREAVTKAADRPVGAQAVVENAKGRVTLVVQYSRVIGGLRSRRTGFQFFDYSEDYLSPEITALVLSVLREHGDVADAAPPPPPVMVTPEDLPASLLLDLDDGSGNISISGMTADIDLEDGSGDIQLHGGASVLLAETLGEHVFDFFLRNKRAEWDEYRGQVSAFERDRMLPVL